MSGHETVRIRESLAFGTTGSPESPVTLRARWCCSVVEWHKKITCINYSGSAPEQYSWILLSSKHFSLPTRKNTKVNLFFDVHLKEKKKKRKKKSHSGKARCLMSLTHNSFVIVV